MASTQQRSNLAASTWETQFAFGSRTAPGFRGMKRFVWSEQQLSYNQLVVIMF
jgi:hypothetical protein